MDPLEQRSLMAASVTAGLNLELASSAQFSALPDVTANNDVGVFQQVDLDLTAQVVSTPQGAQIYVDGSDYNDHIVIQAMNVTTGVVTLRLEQWTAGNQFSNGIRISAKTVQLNAGRALDSYAPVFIDSKGGNDRIVNSTAGTMTVYTGDGADFVSGGGGSEYIDAGDGFDIVYANGGNDIVTARAGDDTVWGGTGNDTIYGDEGEDRLRGNEGYDTIIGGLGNDGMYGEGGADRLYGMAGDDYGRGDETGQVWADYLSGGEGNDVMDGGHGPDTINGDWGNDTLHGGLGNDTLHGGDADDLVLGENGRDLLYGDDGNDGLFGGATDLQDTLWGGLGADRLLSVATRTTGFNAVREDLLADGINGVDVDPMFIHGYYMTRGTDTYTLLYWHDLDVLRVDEVLALLHRQGNGRTTLLQRGIGGNIGFVRHGGTARGFNDGTWIHLTSANNQFGGSDDYFRGYLIHEIGHYWQGSSFKAGGVNYWNQFVGIGGWTSVDPNDPVNYTRSDNEGRGYRWYLTNSGFVSNYAKTNENEDFAESFAAFFMARGRWKWNYGPGVGSATAKMIVFLDWAGKIWIGG